MSDKVKAMEAKPPVTFYMIPDNKSGETFVTREDISLEELLKHKELINFSPEEYQRFFRADLKWQQELMCSFFASEDEPVMIPELALRYHEIEGGILVEVMDGCQRTTTAMRFLEDKFELPKNPAVSDFYLDGQIYNLVGMTFSQIQSKYPRVATYLFEKTFHCQIYVNITDDHAAHVFVNVLNNSNALTAQEKRNAIRSFLASFVRKTARKMEGSKPAPLFALDTNGVDCKYVNISHKKMEVDSMIAELCAMQVFGLDAGTTSGVVNKLYRDPRYISRFDYKASIVEALRLAKSGIDRNSDLKKIFTPKVLRNYLYIVMEMYKSSYHIAPDKFMRLYAKAHAELKILTKEMKSQGFHKSTYSIFMSGTNGPNTVEALNLVRQKMFDLNEVINSPNEAFWTVDPQRCFTPEQIAEMAVVQDNKCGRCGYELGDDTVGAHGYSWADGSLTITGEGYAAHKYCNLEEGKNQKAA